MQALFEHSEEGDVDGLGHISRAGRPVSPAAASSRSRTWAGTPSGFVQRRLAAGRAGWPTARPSISSTAIIACRPIPALGAGRVRLRRPVHRRHRPRPGLRAPNSTRKRARRRGLQIYRNFARWRRPEQSRPLSILCFASGAEFASLLRQSWITPRRSSWTARNTPCRCMVGTEGEKAVDIAQAARRHGLHLLRPGLRQHGLVRERDHLPGRRQGHPAHRGYPIEQLAQHSDFIETAYLIIYGELPNAARGKEFGLLLRAARGHRDPDAADIRGLSEGRPADGDALVDLRLAGRVLSRSWRRTISRRTWRRSTWRRRWRSRRSARSAR